MKKKLLIITTLLIVFSLTLYGCNKKEPKQETNNNQTTVEKATYDEETMKSLFSAFGQCSSGYKLEFGDKTELTYSELPVQLINNILYNYLKHNNKVVSNQGPDDYKNRKVISEDNPENISFAKKDLEEAKEYIIGNKNNIQNKFDLGDYSFDYDESLGEYTLSRTTQYSCGDKKLDGYSVNSIYEEDNKVFVNVIYYQYEYIVSANKKDFTSVYYGTKDNQQFENPNYDFLGSNQEHFLRYLFVFVPKGTSYKFDHVELN